MATTFRSAQQRKAVFARLKRGGQKLWSFAKRHPLAVGTLAAVPLGGLGRQVQMKLLQGIGKEGRYMRRGLRRRITRAAFDLYPQVRGVKVERGAVSSFSSGLGFLDRGKPPTIRMPPLVTSAEFPHEVGHAAASLRFPRFVPNIRAKTAQLSRLLSGQPAVLGSLAAQPLISQLPVSERTKRKLRIGAALIPAAVAAPMLASEAGASVRASRIVRQALKKGRFVQKVIRRRVDLPNAYAFGTYVNEKVLVPSAYAGIPAYLYNKQKKR